MAVSCMSALCYNILIHVNLEQNTCMYIFGRSVVLCCNLPVKVFFIVHVLAWTIEYYKCPIYSHLSVSWKFKDFWPLNSKCIFGNLLVTRHV